MTLPQQVATSMAIKTLRYSIQNPTFPPDEPSPPAHRNANPATTQATLDFEQNESRKRARTLERNEQNESRKRVRISEGNEGAYEANSIFSLREAALPTHPTLRQRGEVHDHLILEPRVSTIVRSRRVRLPSSSW